jgi:hypothetical protein
MPAISISIPTWAPFVPVLNRKEDFLSSEYEDRGHYPKMRRAALPGDPIRKEIFSKDDNTETARLLQQRKLCSRFGFAVETAAAISALAFAVAR